MNTRSTFSRINAGHPRTDYTDTLFSSCDLELDPMTSIEELEDVPGYKNKLPRSRLSKVKS